MNKATKTKIAALALAAAACSSGGPAAVDVPVNDALDTIDGSHDTSGEAPYDLPPADQDPDMQVDTPLDTSTDGTPHDTTDDGEPGPVYKTCVISCTTPSDCCTSSSCGSYPDRWTCEDGYCVGAGCAGDAECTAWASGLGIPDASQYKCRGWEGAYTTCVAGCTSPTDCCNPEYMDCSSYPTRYLCESGGCLMDRCRGDEECRAYAAAYDLFGAAGYACRNTPGTEYYYCALSCTTEAECCPPEGGACTAYPYRYDCLDGFCAARCESDDECRSYAAANDLPHAERYVCREFEL